MKKLMMVLAAMATTVVANAAAVDWNYKVTGAAGGSATEFTGYTAYLVDKAYYDSLSAVTAESDRKSTRLNSSHPTTSRMPSSA